MRRFILIIIHTFFILGPIFAQRSSTDNIIDSVNNAIEKESFKKAWREIHANRHLFIQSNQLFKYNYSLSEIYKGTYQYLDDDLWKRKKP